MRLNFSGRDFNAVSYSVDDRGWVNLDEVERLAMLHRPAMIIAGWSAYPRHLDFAGFRRIADKVGAILMVDMAHFAGLVAAKLHPDPVPFADVITSTTHKTLGGPRGGFVLTNDEAIAKKIDSAVFPGLQGGPLQHVIAAKAVAFRLAMTPEFADRQRRTLEGAKVLAARMFQADLLEAKIAVLTNGTDVHLVLLNLAASDLTGREAEDRLHDVGITVNRNAVPHDPRPPMVTSGVRIGTAALATRGFAVDAFADVADVVAQCLSNAPSAALIKRLRGRVATLADEHPLYPSLAG
jgi:glycine hydroxymethyltransferase